MPRGTRRIDRELLLRLFLAREASASTAIGEGIALPHVRNPIVLYVTRPLVTLCFLEHPIEFGALDGQPVSVLFSLISPSTRAHLQILSKLSRLDCLFKILVGCGKNTSFEGDSLSSTYPFELPLLQNA